VRSVSGVRAQASQLQTQALTGRRVTRASDAPESWQRIEDLQGRRSAQETYATNSKLAEGAISAADQALADASNVMKRVTELALAASSEASGASYLDAAPPELRSLRDELLSIANREFGGRQIFSGRATDTPAFDALGVYQGSNDVVTSAVSATDRINQSFDGQAIFQGTEDTFGLIDQAVTAMEAGDSDAVAGLLTHLNAATKQLILARSEVGIQQRRNEDLGVVATESESLLRGLVDGEVDADPVETYAKIGAIQANYEAVLKITASSLSSNLFQLMR